MLRTKHASNLTWRGIEPSQPRLAVEYTHAAPPFIYVDVEELVMNKRSFELVFDYAKYTCSAATTQDM